MLFLPGMKTTMKLVIGSLVMSSVALAGPAPDFLGAPAKPHIDPHLVASSGTAPIEPSDILAFRFNDDLLTTSGYDQVDRAALWLKVHPKDKIVLEGHTDKVGDPPYNNDLAMRRVFAARKRLMQDNISTDRIIMLGYGEVDSAENPADRRVRMYTTRLSPQAVLALTVEDRDVVASWTEKGKMMQLRRGMKGTETITPTVTARR